MKEVRDAPVAYRFKHEHQPHSWKYADKNPNCRPWNSFEPLYSASTVEALLSRVERLEKALKPFAEASVWRADRVEVMTQPRPPWPSDFDLMEFARNSLTLCDLFDARAAIKENTDGN